jgi:hypothetical protein
MIRSLNLVEKINEKFVEIKWNHFNNKSNASKFETTKKVMRGFFEI